MDITVLDKTFAKVGIIDVFESFLWIERYNDIGDFELYTAMSPDILDLVRQEYYLQIPDSDRTMIVESFEIKTDIEAGNKLIIRGRSLESILDRRIILQQTILNDFAVQSAILTILDQNIIVSSQPDRNISNFIRTYNSDPATVSPTMTAQYDGEQVDEVIIGLCKQVQIGFRVLLNASNQFEFMVYAGQDRSYTQSTLPFVVFSPAFDNLLNSDYLETIRFKKTYALLFGDSTVDPRPRVQAYDRPTGRPTGIDRREMFVDAGDISRTNYGTIPPSEIDPTIYNEEVRARAYALFTGDNGPIYQFQGQADTSHSFEYRADFFLGDIVQIENEFGMTARSRITEVTISENLSGKYMYPTFVPL